MDELLKKDTWEILSILFFVFGGIFAISWLFIKNKVKLKYKDLSFNDNDVSNLPFKLRHQDYLTFSLFFKDINTLLKDRFRTWCIENGIVHKDETEWRDYKEMRIDQLHKTIIQFFAENYVGSVLTIDEFNENFQFTDNMDGYLNNIFEEIRLVSKEVEIQKSILNNNIDVYIKNKTDELMTMDSPENSHIITIVTTAGKQLVEIHELENRSLIRRQMQKVEEILLTAYTDNTFKFLTLLNRKLKEENEKV
jgi:hypothetical protein